MPEPDPTPPTRPAVELHGLSPEQRERPARALLLSLPWDETVPDPQRTTAGDLLSRL